jgi:hypothetical protein
MFEDKLMKLEHESQHFLFETERNRYYARVYAEQSLITGGINVNPRLIVEEKLTREAINHPNVEIEG